MIHQLIQQFNTIFENDHVPQVFFAPYQINIMGDYTDYNKGMVLPVALSFGNYAIVQKREDKKIQLFSMEHPDKMVTCDLDRLTYQPKHHWANYPKGVIYLLIKSGLPIDTGFDILYATDIPESKSLSSNASIEMVTAILLNELFQLELDRLTLSKYCQKAENNYIGFNNGMMDKFAIGFGKEDHALLLNCDTYEVDYIPAALENHRFLIIDTNKPKTMSDQEFNERRNECELSLHALQAYINIKHLGELTMETFANAKHILKDPILEKRVKHVVSENERTKQAAAFLETMDMESLGKTFTASHISLQQNYNMTGNDVDQVVKIAEQQIGVLGAKVTAGGFGGCVIALIEEEYLPYIQKRIHDQYYEETGNIPIFHPVTISEGAKEITEGEFDI